MIVLLMLDEMLTVVLNIIKIEFQKISKNIQIYNIHQYINEAEKSKWLADLLLHDRAEFNFVQLMLT
jgi:hypothetical protein